MERQPAERSPTAALLCQCVRPTIDPDTGSRIEALARQDVDWKRFDRLTRRHRVIPLVHRALTTASEVVPADLLEALKADRAAITRRNLAMTRELIAIIESLGANDVPILPFKGPVLAAAAYDDVGMREFVDLDLLCRPCDAFHVSDRLRAREYSHVFSVEGMPEAAVCRYLKSFNLARERDGVVVDVHWRLVERRFPPELTMERVKSRTATVSLGGRDIPALSPEDSLLFLVVHGTKHKWERLGWICDVAAALQDRDIDWVAVRNRAQAMGVCRMLGLGLLLARDLLDVTVPSAVAGVTRDDGVTRLATTVRGHLFDETGPDDSVVANLSFQLRALDRRRDGLRFLTQLLTSPKRSEFARVSLPSRLYPLYRVIRPVRLGVKYGRRVLAPR